jgi:hypothetical protein
VDDVAYFGNLRDMHEFQRMLQEDLQLCSKLSPKLQNHIAALNKMRTSHRKTSLNESIMVFPKLEKINILKDDDDDHVATLSMGVNSGMEMMTTKLSENNDKKCDDDVMMNKAIPVADPSPSVWRSCFFKQKEVDGGLVQDDSSSLGVNCLRCFENKAMETPLKNGERMNFDQSQ